MPLLWLPVALSGATATFTTSTLAIGDHPITGECQRFFIIPQQQRKHDGQSATGQQGKHHHNDHGRHAGSKCRRSELCSDGLGGSGRSGGRNSRGNVTVSDGTNTCVIILPATSCQLASTSPGAKTLTAVYSGSSNYNGSRRCNGFAYRE